MARACPRRAKMQSDRPHAIIWTRAVRSAIPLLHFIGHPDQVGGELKQTMTPG